MITRSLRMIIGIACACSAGSAVAQNVLRADTVQNGYSRLRDYTARIINAIAPTSPDVFGTTAVSAGVTFYDARFRRVSLADRADPAVLAIAERLRGLTPDAQLATVQREVLRRVKWSHDLDNMHVADFWSNAGETLARGTGDSEDIAIVEMQALKAAGFNARDLYISIGRQKQVGAHIVLLARTPSGFTVLDDRTRVPIAAEDDRVFTPVLTVGEGKSWVHGHRIRSIVLQASALAERAMAPLSTSR